MARPKSLSVSSDGGTSMLGIRPFTSRDSSDDGDADSKKRNRITLACGRCRMRKIRCDGERICNKCTAAGTKCEYVAVTKEENLVAREKKALSKANRTKGIKVTLPKLPSAPSMPKLGRKFSVKKNKVTGLTDVPVAAPQLDIQALPVDESYYLSPIGDSHYIDGAFSESNEDIAGLATPNTYFEYSSSTSSLPSDYEAALSSASPVAPYQYSRSYKALDYSIAAGSSAGPVHNFRDPHRTSNTTIPGYVQSATDQSHIVHQSYMFASDCAQSSPMSYPSMSNESPSGLCLYIPGSPARTASPAVGIIPSFPYGHTRSYSTPLSPAVSQTPSPRVYQGGPIDWSARPLAPFAISSTSTVSQTVRMDEICKVSL